MNLYHKYHNYIKALVAAGIIAWSVFQFIDGNIGNGISLILLSMVVALLIFRNEFILISFLHLRRNKLDKAGSTLSNIKFPESLIKSQEAYYYYLNGLVNSQTNLKEAARLFKKALSKGLKGKQDRAVAKLNLATSAAMRRRKREATMLLKEAQDLDKHGLLEDQIKMLKQQFKRI